MDDCSIAERTNTFRRELELIQQDERVYRSQLRHSRVDKQRHAKREFRILQIREELRALVEKARKRSDDSSVWFKVSA